MFFTTQSSVKKKVTEALMPCVSAYRLGGLPHGFWQEPYLLGWLYGSAAIFTRILGQGKFRGERGVAIILDVFKSLANDGGESGIAAVRLFNIQEPSFMEGFENGMLCVEVSLGADHSGNSLVITAKERAKNMRSFMDANFGSSSSEVVDVVTQLELMLFHEPIEALKSRGQPNA